MSSAIRHQLSDISLPAGRADHQLILVIFVWLLLAGNWLLACPAQAATKNFWSETLTDNIVINPYQGLGVCHWASPAILADPIVSWAYDSGDAVFWTNVEPLENQFNWSGLDGLVNLAQSKGKKIWLQLYNTNGLVPNWALNKTVNGQKMVMMGGATTDCSAMEANLPLPWDPTYLALWRKAIHKMAEKYDDNPGVEAIVMMAGGGYGEMVVCNTCGNDVCWQQYAGGVNIDTKFAEAVKNLIDLYLEREHVWGNEGVLPAGTKTHGFLNKPVVLQLGSGVTENNSVIRQVLDYAIPKYGLRVLLKTNGWHCGSCESDACENGHSGLAQSYYTNFLADDLTKFGLEPRGNPNINSSTITVPDFNSMVNCRNKISYACLQSDYWEGSLLQNLRSGREGLAKDIGSKVGLKEVTYPDSVTAGQTYSFSVKMKNLGDVPPFRPKRINAGTSPKDIAASYQISFQLIKDNQTAFSFNADLNPPSDHWTPDQEITFSQQILIGAGLATGDYELRVTLFDPEGKVRSRQEYFRFLNKDLLDPEGRAKIGAIRVQGTSVTPTTTPSPTPTQATGAGTFLNFKVEFEGKNQDQTFLIKFVLKGIEFFKQIIYTSRVPARMVYLKIPEVPAGRSYDFILSSFPFLNSKKSFIINRGVNPTGGTVADFGTLKTGDLNGDNQINGLDWSLMKTNFGQSGEE